MKVFFTGDLHFGHENVLKFDNRPFTTVEEMDAELIRRWNNKVSKCDLVYVLGDMIWKTHNDDAPSLIKSLNGQIILITLNNLYIRAHILVLIVVPEYFLPNFV